MTSCWYSCCLVYVIICKRVFASLLLPSVTCCVAPFTQFSVQKHPKLSSFAQKSLINRTMAVCCSRPPLPVYLSCCSSPPLICHFLLLNPSSQFAPSRLDDVLPACVCRSVLLGPVGFSLSSLHLPYLRFQGGIKLFRPETRLHLSSFISLQTLWFFDSTWLDCYYICIHTQEREFRKIIPQSYLICKENFSFSFAWCCLQLSSLISMFQLEKWYKFRYKWYKSATDLHFNLSMLPLN